MSSALNRKRLVILTGVSITLSFAIYTTIYLPFYSMQSYERRKLRFDSYSNNSVSGDVIPQPIDVSDNPRPGHKRSNSMWGNLDDQIKGRNNK